MGIMKRPTTVLMGREEGPEGGREKGREGRKDAQFRFGPHADIFLVPIPICGNKDVPTPPK